MLAAVKQILLLFLFCIYVSRVASARRAVEIVSEDDVKQYLEEQINENDEDDDNDDETNVDDDEFTHLKGDPIWIRWRLRNWRPRLGSMLLRTTYRLLQPVCSVVCTGLCQRKVPGECKCENDLIACGKK